MILATRRIKLSPLIGGFLGLFGMMLIPAAAAATTTTPPDWPCVQRYIPTISSGMVWGGPPLREGGQRDTELIDLAADITQRGVDLAAVEADLEAFAARVPMKQRGARLADLFGLALEQINRLRDEVIGKVTIFSRKLRGQLERIEALKERHERATSAEQQKIRVALDWENQVLRRRNEQLRLLCEQPVRLEQRAFALGRIVANLIP